MKKILTILIILLICISSCAGQQRFKWVQLPIAPDTLYLATSQSDGNGHWQLVSDALSGVTLNYVLSNGDDANNLDIINLDSLDVNLISLDGSILAPSWTEGKIYYDTATNALTVYDDIEEASLQVGQEVRVRVYNNNGVTIENGAAVTVTGLTFDGVLEVGLAIASDETSALNTIGIATHDIEPSTYGWATTTGVVNDVNTIGYTEGAAIYLSETVAGAYQETRPLSPSYEVRMGGIAESDISSGKIYAELRIISNDQDNNAFFNGAILEANRVDIVSNGVTVNCSLKSEAANNKLSLIFEQSYISVNDGINIDLTLGTATNPVENWVYIDPNGVMQVSLSGFPATEYVPVARVVVPDATTALNKGVYKVHAYTDHLQNSVGQGHLSHLNDWVRKRPAAWQSGVVLTQSPIEGTSTTRIDLGYTSGNISQLHEHSFPIYNTATRSAFVVNDFDTPYEVADGITSLIDEDSNGDPIGNNKFYNLVVWGVVSEETKDCKLFFNLPSGSYSNLADALNDVSNYTDYTIPTAYLGTGFLITKLTLQRTTTNVQVQVGGTIDLRGSIPAVGGGSVIGGGGITTFDDLTDTPISKTGQSGNALRVNSGENALEYYLSDLQAAYDNSSSPHIVTSGTGLHIESYNAAGAIPVLRIYNQAGDPVFSVNGSGNADMTGYAVAKYYRVNNSLVALTSGNGFPDDGEIGSIPPMGSLYLRGDPVQDSTLYLKDYDSNWVTLKDFSYTNELDTMFYGATIIVDGTDIQPLIQSEISDSLSGFNINDADADPTNEYNDSITIDSIYLIIHDGGGADSVELASNLFNNSLRHQTTLPDTLGSSDYIYVNDQATNGVLVLPSDVVHGKIFIIKNYDVGTLTIDPISTTGIDGNPTVILDPIECITVVYDKNTNEYYIISAYEGGI